MFTAGVAVWKLSLEVDKKGSWDECHFKAVIMLCEIYAYKSALICGEKSLYLWNAKSRGLHVVALRLGAGQIVGKNSK